MKLSLWQQFSSNHSGAYVIVGVFQSEAQAQQAQNDLNDLMMKILAFNAPPERFDDFTPSPVETEYARAHNITWTETIFWLRPLDEPFQEIIDEHVTRFGQHVVIDSRDETLQGEEKRALALLKTLSSEVYHRTDDSYFQLSFVCHAPDHASARIIYEALLRYRYDYNKVHFYQPPPWTPHHPLGTQLLQGLTRDQYTALAEAWQIWYDIVQAHSDGEGETLVRQLLHVLDEVPFLHNLHSLWRQMSLPEAHIQITRQDQQIHLKDDKQTADMLYAIPAIHAWLVALGCQVTYTFSQEVW